MWNPNFSISLTLCATAILVAGSAVGQTYQYEICGQPGEAGTQIYGILEIPTSLEGESELSLEQLANVLASWRNGANTCYSFDYTNFEGSTSLPLDAPIGSSTLKPLLAPQEVNGFWSLSHETPDEFLSMSHFVTVTELPGGDFDYAAGWVVFRFTTENAFFDSQSTDEMSDSPAWSLKLIGENSRPSQLIYREADNSGWDIGGATISGWDHVGLYHNGMMLESHPGYPIGNWFDPTNEKYICISPARSGVQLVHSYGSFVHNSRETDTLSASIGVNIDSSRAQAMKEYIASQAGQPFLQFCTDYWNPECWEELAPENQKNLTGNGFTCVGLIERAAEVADPFGQGFIPNQMERIRINQDLAIPLLSPVYHSWFAQGQLVFDEISSWFGGMIIDGDFLITDPQGRRFGFTAELGEVNEIPGAFFSGAGDVEQFFIPNPIIGNYEIDLFGRDLELQAAFGGSVPGEFVEEFVMLGASEQVNFRVPLMGDINFDSVVDLLDVVPFVQLLAGPGESYIPEADINLDNEINLLDVEPFVELLSQGP